MTEPLLGRMAPVTHLRPIHQIDTSENSEMAARATKSEPKEKEKRKNPSWPGRLPRPSPAIVLPEPLPATVRDTAGNPVGVSARLELTGEPATLAIDRARPEKITGWAGPWPVDERWWAPDEARRRARFQMTTESGRALLLSLSRGRWQVEAIYD